jgi:hypothetical protein
MESYAKTDRKLDALTEAMKLVLKEFEMTKDAEVAAAAHVLSALIVRHMEALDKQLDDMLDKAGL